MEDALTARRGWGKERVDPLFNQYVTCARLEQHPELNSLRIVIHASLLAYYSFVRSYSSVTEY